MAFKEDFETDKKSSYEAETVKLASGDWVFQDALVGSTDEDHKLGKQAVRIRNQGKITMNFDLPAGASSITVRHATYGKDESSDWELWYSVTKGKSWKQAGQKLTSTSTTLKKAIFSLVINGNIRLEIRKVSGTKDRLNFDDIVVEPFGSTATLETNAPNIPATPTPVPTVKKTVGNPASIHLLLGNPSKAIAGEKNPDNYLMLKPQYALSYNRAKGIPNWVSWYVNSTWLGTADRQNDFRPDKDLPAGWPRITPTDYTGGGFDRGHVCPSADRQSTEENNSATFLMTNMIPQSPDNNQGPWEKLEAYSRRLVEKNIELYIIAGNYGTGGTGSNGFRKELKGKRNAVRVVVPSHTWKVVVVLPEAGNNGTPLDDLSRINANTRVIAIDVPNVQGIKQDYWTKYLTSVDAIEKATGYDLLSNLPKNIQDALESKVSK